MSESDEETSFNNNNNNTRGLDHEDQEHQPQNIDTVIPPKQFIEILHTLSIDKLLILLDKYNITIPPGATKDELVDILIRSRLQNVNEKKSRRVNNNPNKVRNENKGDISIGEQRRQQRQRHPHRLEEEIYTNTSSATKEQRPKSSTSSSIPKRKQRQRRRERRHEPSSSKWNDIDLESTSRIAKRLGYTAANAAKYATNDLSQRMQSIVNIIYDPNDTVDENGIREARWEYVYKNIENTNNDVRRRPRQRNTSKKSNRRTMKRSMDKDGNNVSDNIGSSPSDMTKVLPPILNDVEYFPDISTNEIPRSENNSKIMNVTQNTTDPVTERRAIRRERKSYDADKKVYSVYPMKDDDEERRELEDLYGEAIVSAIDTVGEFVVDVTEGRYWKNTTGSGPGAASNRNTTKKIKENNTTTTKLHKKRYWRDRLAERVDYALGVHEDGQYYKKWQDQLEHQKSRERGNDAVSIFYGHQKKNRGPKKPVAFWEEDGSLMSLFFGRTPDGRTLSLSKLFERENSVNICTTIFKSSFKTFLAILSYLCRWASCRGALPQPIVVFLLSASALSAPKRRRLMTIGITLIALRTIAEIIHGYVYGNEDWEDDEPYSDDDIGGQERVEEWEGDGL